MRVVALCRHLEPVEYCTPVHQYHSRGCQLINPTHQPKPHQEHADAHCNPTTRHMRDAVGLNSPAGVLQKVSDGRNDLHHASGRVPMRQFEYFQVCNLLHHGFSKTGSRHDDVISITGGATTLARSAGTRGAVGCFALFPYNHHSALVENNIQTKQHN